MSEIPSSVEPVNALPSGDSAFHRQQARQLRAQAEQFIAAAARHEREATRQEQVRVTRAQARRQEAYQSSPQRTIDRRATPVLDSWIHPDDLRCTVMKQGRCQRCGKDSLISRGRILSSGTTVIVCHSCHVVTPTDHECVTLTFKIPTDAAPELHLVGDES